MTETVRADEVYSLAVDAWNHAHGGWQWSSLTASEREEWLDTATPIVRAVLEAQRAAPVCDEVDRQLSQITSWLARSGMKHDTFDNLYTPLLLLRDRLVPGRYS